MVDPAQFKEGQKAVWSMGEYPNIAVHLEPAAAALVEAANVGPGDEIADIAAGTGNLTLAAQAAGADVVASDLTPGLIAIGRERAPEADWHEADAEDLPFADGIFDAALSAFGLIFAPRPEVAIAEAFRVTRPGGVVGLTAWTPEGVNGRFFEVVKRHLDLPEDAPDSRPWGDEATARARMDPHSSAVTVKRAALRYRFSSPEEARELNTRSLGPLVAARAALGEERFEALAEDLMAMLLEANEATDGSVDYPAEYLLITARKGAA